MMKLKIRFGSETRFNQPIRHTTLTRVQPSPGCRVSLRTGNGWTAKTDQAPWTGCNFREDSNP
jgi:hypothetical protein